MGPYVTLKVPLPNQTRDPFGARKKIKGLLDGLGGWKIGPGFAKGEEEALVPSLRKKAQPVKGKSVKLLELVEVFLKKRE